MPGSVVFKDLGLNAFLQGVKALSELRLRVGVVGEKASQTASSGRITVGEAAIINEYGAPSRNIPARHAVSGTITEADAMQMGQEATDAVVNFQDPRPALEKAGEKMADKIRDRIYRADFQANAAATVKKKGFDHPLLDSSQMADAVGHQVVTGDGGDAEAYESFEVT